MRRFRMIMLMLAMTAAACGGGGGDDDDIDAGAPTTAAGQATTTAAVPTTSPGTTVAASALTLKVTDVRLINSEESDSGMRILLPAGVASASVTIASGLPTPNRVISVCQANDLDRRMSTAACRTPANGEAVNVNLGTAASGVEIIQVGVSAAGAEGNSTALGEVSIRYSTSSREIRARLPQIAGGDQGGGRPTFGLTPASANGAYRAQLNWTIIPVFGGSDSRARLELVQGANVANQANSTASEARLEGTLSPAAEAAIRINNVGTAAMVTPKITVLLP